MKFMTRGPVMFESNLMSQPLKKASHIHGEISRGRCLERLIDLVSIDSSSNNIEGVFLTQKRIARSLIELGFTEHYIGQAENKFAPLLVCKKFGGFNKTISLVMHADTVLDSSDFLSRNFLKFEKGRMFGPGVIDNKGGIVIAIEGLRHFLQRMSPEFNIQVISVPNEELGSIGFHQQLKQLGECSDLILGFEPALDSGDIITSRHGNRWYSVEIIGKEAHSGRCNGEQINAAHELAYKIVNFLNLTNEFEDIKLNVGSLYSSKDKFNVVCGDVSIKLDLRFSCNDIRDQVHQKILEILSRAYIKNKFNESSITKFELADDCPAFKHLESSQAYVNWYLHGVEKIENKAIKAAHAGGASDVNYMSHKNAISMDGLGAIGGNMHTNEEFVHLASIKNRALALSHFLLGINNSNLTIRS